MLQEQEEEKTLIQVSKNTWEKLKELRITKRESFDEVLNRVIDWNQVLESKTKEGGSKKSQGL